MRRFVEEIKLTDPLIAEKIVKALETRDVDKRTETYKGLEYEVDMYEHGRDYDPCRNKPDERGYIILKIFIKEKTNDQT